MKMDVPAVIRRVRQEVARRQGGPVGHFDSGATGPDRLPTWSTALPPVPRKTEYTCGELLLHSDRAFVEGAYMAVLRRPSDPDGREACLQKLRSGAMSKIDVLAELRWSAEGRACGVHVDGLLLPAKLHQWRRKRLIGPIIKWVHAVFRLPNLAERSSYSEAIQSREIQELGRLLNQLSGQIGDRLSSGETAQAMITDRLKAIEGEGLQQLQQLQSDADQRLQQLDTALLSVQDAHKALDDVVSQQCASGAAAAVQLAALQARIEACEAASVARNQAFAAALADQEARIVAQRSAIEEQNHILGAQQARIVTFEAANSTQYDALAADIFLHKDQIAAHGSSLGQITRAEELRQANDHALDPMYVAFEEQFRGPRDLIRERSLPYLDIIREADAGTPEAPVLDVGCGRGDWLDIMREHGLTARGVDTNRVFLDICRGRGLEVLGGDAVEVLRGLDAGSVGAITGMHIAEHLPFEVLVALLDEAKRVLRVGGILALETPNPENLMVASHLFYMDPTHRNPLPPEALKWIVEARGFAETRIERWTVARDLGAPPLLDAEMPGAASVNVLLKQLQAAPDYAIIARRIQ